MSRTEQLTGKVKSLALEAGFDRVGIAPADAVRGRQNYQRWLEAGRHADMSYLARNLDKRFCPQKLVEGAASVICLAVSYAPGPEEAQGPGQAAMPFVARYARGRDYHKVLTRRCRCLMDRIETEVPQFAGRAFVDSAPLAERALAATAGLGWIGRNGCVIVPGLGSYVVLAEIVCNLELAPDQSMALKCGDCNACVSACPTGALLGDGLVHARKCLSYLTIEYRGRIDGQLLPAWGSRVFGCDSCQDVCPHNQSVPPGDDELRQGALHGQALHRTCLADILAWDEQEWDEATTGSVTRRAKLDALLRNAVIASGNSGQADLTAPLRDLARRRPELGELAERAINRLS